MKISPREILKENELKEILKQCFKKCYLARKQLGNCVNNSIKDGSTKEEIISIAINLSSKDIDNESYLCAVVAIFQALKYKGKIGKIKKIKKNEYNRNKIEKDLKNCFKKCNTARDLLNENINLALSSGFTKEEILNISDNLVGGFEKKGTSICGIIAINQIIKFEENEGKK